MNFSCPSCVKEEPNPSTRIRIGITMPGPITDNVTLLEQLILSLQKLDVKIDNVELYSPSY